MANYVSFEKANTIMKFNDRHCVSTHFLSYYTEGSLFFDSLFRGRFLCLWNLW